MTDREGVRKSVRDVADGDGERPDPGASFVIERGDELAVAGTDANIGRSEHGSSDVTPLTAELI